MLTSRNGCSGPRNTWRLIFKQCCSLMSAVKPWMVQMDWVVDGWWMANMPQQGCDVSKEVEESCFEPESWGESWSAPLGSLKMWKWPLNDLRWCKEYLCIINCYGHKRRETTGVDLWSILKQKSYEGGWQFTSKTAAVEGYSDILQRNSSRISKNWQIQWMLELWSCCQIRVPVLKRNLTC